MVKFLVTHATKKNIYIFILYLYQDIHMKKNESCCQNFIPLTFSFNLFLLEGLPTILSGISFSFNI